MVELESGDLLHFYAAAVRRKRLIPSIQFYVCPEPVLAKHRFLRGGFNLTQQPFFFQTPGWVDNGNYTAGYIILDKDDPTRIIQRGSGQFMVPRFEYETLCGGAVREMPFSAFLELRSF
eukprot:COSAG06_NODE_1145_length_10532_cov_16.966261_4_plen_119_part_00